MVNGNTFVAQFNLSLNDLELIHKIHSIREKGNFQTMYNVVGKSNVKCLLNKLYPNNDIKNLEKILGVPDSSISHWFKLLGITSVRKHLSNNSYAANFNSSIVLPLNKTAINFSAINVDADLAYLIGFSLGDGTVEKYSLEVFNKDLGMQKYLESIMSKYGAVTKSVTGKRLWKLRLSSIKIANLVKQNKQVNEDTLNFIFSDNLLAQKFLAGFWDAEGSVLKQAKYFHLYLYNSNKILMDRIKNYLDSLGFDCSILEIKKRQNIYYLDGRPIITKKIIYRLSVKKKDMKKWVNMIGIYLMHSKKSAVIKEILLECE